MNFKVLLTVGVNNNYFTWLFQYFKRLLYTTLSRSYQMQILNIWFGRNILLIFYSYYYNEPLFIRSLNTMQKSILCVSNNCGEHFSVSIATVPNSLNAKSFPCLKGVLRLLVDSLHTNSSEFWHQHLLGNTSLETLSLPPSDWFSM